MRNLADATNVGDARSLALAFARSRPLSAPKRGARESPTSPATKKIQITHLKMRAVEEERRVLRLGSRVERKEKNCREKRSERRQSDFGEKISREREAREKERRERKNSSSSSSSLLRLLLPFPSLFPPPTALSCSPSSSLEARAVSIIDDAEASRRAAHGDPVTTRAGPDCPAKVTPTLLSGSAFGPLPRSRSCSRRCCDLRIVRVQGLRDLCRMVVVVVVAAVAVVVERRDERKRRLLGSLFLSSFAGRFPLAFVATLRVPGGLQASLKRLKSGKERDKERGEAGRRTKFSSSIWLHSPKEK